MWARKYAPFISSAFMQVLQKHEGLDLSKNKLFVPEGNLHAIYFEENELNKIVLNYMEVLLGQKMSKYAIWYERQFRHFLIWSKKTTRHDFSQYANRQLADTIKELFSRLIDFSELQFYAFLVVEGAAKVVERKLANQPHMLEAISTPYKHTEMAKSRIALLKLVAKGKINESDLIEYIKKYAWLPIYDFTDKPLNLDDVKNQITNVQSAKEELQHIAAHQKEGLHNYSHFLKTVKDTDFKKLIEIVHYFSFLKEMRDDYRRHAYYLWIPFWQEIGSRLNFTVEEVNYLIEPELVVALHEGKDMRDIVKARRERYAHLLKEGELSVYGGENAKKIEALVKNKNETTSSIKGFSACKGKVCGKINIIYHQEEFSKFEKGDILVTAMTHPEFLVIMKKAAAIVTDEGGITCHAAITSRELKIPCIIGTKIATRVLKDGDMVEVDANKGIVKIIKRTETK